MGILPLLVLFKLFRSEWAVCSSPWRRQLYVELSFWPVFIVSLVLMVKHHFTAADSSRDMMASPFGNANVVTAGPQDFNKLLKAERDNLEFSAGLYSWAGKNVETRVLQKYGKLPPLKTL
jgi:hypothetical protein